MNANSTPTPRIGDVILIPAGACPEYRAAFRLRVSEILTRAGRGTLDRPIVGGTVVNANGQDRMLKGTPVERACTVDLGAVTVVTPAPATDAEIRAAYADHAAREIERTRCAHAPDALGCTHVHCVGVPPVDAATSVEPEASDVATPAEYGTQTLARTLRDTLRAYPTITDASMPRVTTTGEGNGRTRPFTVATSQVDGHAVNVIMWEGPRCAPMTAVMIDGVLINADVTGGRAMRNDERTNMIVWRVADALRDTATVEPADTCCAQCGSPASSNRHHVARPAGHPFVAEGEATMSATVAQVEPATVTLADPAARALATMTALTADVVHVGCLHGLKGAPGCHVTGCDMPIRPALVTCPECLAWLAGESGRAWAGRWAGNFARIAQSGYGCAGFTPRDGWPHTCAGCLRPDVAHTPALSAYPHNLGADAPVTESEATMSATVPATVAQVEPAAVPVVDAAPDVLAALLAGEPIPADALTPVEPARLSVTVDRDTLADALTLAAWSAPRRPSVPVLSGVMITADADAGTVTFGSFDYEVFSINALPATVTAAGRVLVDVKALRDMVKTFPKVKRLTAAQVRKGVTLPAGAGMVTLTDTGSAVTVEYGAARASLPTLPAEDYPAIMLGTATPATVAQVDADILAATVARVTVAAGKDDTLPMLTGVQLTTDADGLRAHLAATDRYRLAVDATRWVPVVPDGAEPREHIMPALIPAATLAYAAKWFGRTAGVVTVGMTYGTRSTMTGSGKTAKTVVTTYADSITLTCGPVTIGTRTLDGEFPAVRALLPDTYAGTAQVDAHALADVVARVGMVAARSTPVRLTWSADAVTVAATGDGDATASETMPASADVADGFTMGLNHAFLIDGLRAFSKGAAVRFGFVSASKPAVIESADTDGPDAFRYLIMPVRIGGGSESAAPSTPVGHRSVAVEPAPVVEPVVQVEPVADVTPVEPAAPAAPVEPVAQVEPVAAPVVAPAAPVAVEPVTVPASVDLHGVTVERVAEILRTGTWSSAVVRVGKGRERRPMGVRVLALNAGRLDYATEYKAVAAVLATLGGGWNREVKGFAFAPSETVWNGAGAGARTPEPSAKVTGWLDRYAPAADSAPVAQVEPVADVAPAETVNAAPADVPAVDAHDAAEHAAQVVHDAMTAGDYPGARVALGDVARVAPAGYLVAGRFTLDALAGIIDAAERDALASAPAPVAQVEPAAVVEPAAILKTPSAPGVVLPMVAAGTRVRVTREPVTVVGSVEYEPGMVRVRHADGSVTRTLREYVTPVEPAAPAVEPVAAPVVEPAAIDADDADTLAAGTAAALAAMVEPVEPAAASVVELDAAGRLSFTIAPYAEDVNEGRSYKATRKHVHAALRAAKVRATVHADTDSRRGMHVECDAADRVRVAVIVRNTVTVVEPAAATV